MKGEHVDINLQAKRMYEKLISLSKMEYESSRGNLFFRSGSSFYAYLLFLDKVKSRLSKKFDAVIAVSGAKGYGKSNFSIYSAMVLSHMLGNEFSLRNNIIFHYDHKEAIKKITTAKSNTFVFDEAVDAMTGTDSITRVGKALAKTFVKIRKRTNIYFINIPRFWMLGKYWKADLIHFRIEILRRTEHYAEAALLVPDKDPNNPDPWFQEYDAKKARTRRFRFTTADVIYNIKKHPCFVAFMKIPRLPEWVSRKYEEESLASIERISEEIVAMDTKNKKKSPLLQLEKYAENGKNRKA